MLSLDLFDHWLVLVSYRLVTEKDIYHQQRIPCIGGSLQQQLAFCLQILYDHLVYWLTVSIAPLHWKQLFTLVFLGESSTPCNMPLSGIKFIRS